MRKSRASPVTVSKVSEHSPTSQGPRQDPPRGTRERILDAAARVVRTRGLSHATTKEIAREAELSEAALYKYFRDKDELVLLLMHERVPQWVGVLKDLLARVGQKTVASNLETVAYEGVLFYADFVPMASSLFGEPVLLAKHQKQLRPQNLGPHRANEALAEYIRGEQRGGRVGRAVDAEAVAALVLGAVFQRAFFRRYLGLAFEEKAERLFAKQLARTVVGGL